MQQTPYNCFRILRFQHHTGRPQLPHLTLSIGTSLPGLGLAWAETRTPSAPRCTISVQTIIHTLQRHSPPTSCGQSLWPSEAYSEDPSPVTLATATTTQFRSTSANINPVIINGYLIYTECPGSSTYPAGEVGVDLYTGQTVWTDNVGNYGGSTAQYSALSAGAITAVSFGQILNYRVTQPVRRPRILLDHGNP